MGKKLTNFEESVRSSFDNFEPPYDPQSWEEIESQLDEQQPNEKKSSSLVAGSLLVVASILLLFSSYYFISKSNETTLVACNDNGELVSKAIVNRTTATPSDSQNDVESTNDLTTSSDPAPTSKDLNSRDGIAEANSGTLDVNNKNGTGDLADSDEGNNSSDGGNELVQAPKSSAIAFKSSLTEACAGVEVEFELLNEEIDGTYLWNFGDGNFSNQPNPKHVFQKPGVYDISLSVRSLEDGVIRSNSVSKMVVINPRPKANFDWEFTNEQEEITKVNFLNKSERAGESEWHFHDGSVSTEINPENDYKNKGEHLVKLIVSNKFGCVDSTFKYVDVKKDYNLNAPRTISLQKGEGFMPEALKNSSVSFSLTIYDNKQPIFETMSRDNPWQGTDLDGEEVLPGMSYPWVVIIYDESNNEKEIFSGTVTVHP
ncbi:PKD domain-containing protein [Halocola ammonii]